MQITFTKKSEYYGRNRKGTAVGIEVLPLSNGIITLRPINTRGITDSCNIELPTVVDGLILADEIRKQAMAMAETPDTVCGWLIYMNDDEDAAINEILSSAPLSVLGEAATSKTQAIGIGHEYAPELFKPLYDRYVADQTTAILQQVVDSKILFSQLRDAYKSKLIADIQSKLPNYWVKLDEEYQCRVDGESFTADEISSEGLNGWTVDETMVDFVDMDISDLEYIQQHIVGDGFIAPQNNNVSTTKGVDCEKPEAPDTTPLWDSIPTKYNFVAIDECGDEYAYMEEPHMEMPPVGYGNWTAPVFIYPTGRKFNMDNIDWTKTLSVRP